MGLHVTHDCWDSSYGAFNEWRMRLAVIAGYPLKEIARVENGAHRYYLVPAIDHGAWPSGVLDGEWDRPAPDALLVLLLHSDFEGRIYRDEQIPLADRLEYLWTEMGADDEDAGLTLNFANGLREAHEADDDVRFE